MTNRRRRGPGRGGGGSGPRGDQYSSSNGRFDGPGPRGVGGGGGGGAANYGATGQHRHHPYKDDRGQPNGGGGYDAPHGQRDDYGSNYRGPGPSRGGPLAGRGGGGHGRDLNGPRPNRLPVQHREAPSQEVRLDRLARERVSRTLFCRNVAYEVDSEKFRDQFAQFGEIREWFDAIRRRGMFDVRAAEAAKEAMLGHKLYGRAIDVHFSLPKDHDQDGPCDASKNQGSVMVTLSPRRMLEERELGEAAEVSGAIKAIKSCGYQEKRIVEFYDSRAAQDFEQRMNHQSFLGGRLTIEYIWDVGEVVNHDIVTADAIHQATTSRPFKSGPVGANAVPVPDRHESYNPPDRRESYNAPDRRESYGTQDQRESYGAPDRRESYGTRSGYDRTHDRPPHERLQYDRPPHERPPHQRDYDSRSYEGGSRYGDAPPTSAAPAAGPEGRLDQARKVQDLLASLGNVASLPGVSASTSNPPPVAAPPTSYAPPPQQPYGAPVAQTYGPPRPQAPPPPSPAPVSSTGYPSYPPNASPAAAPAYPPYPPPASSYPPPPAVGGYRPPPPASTSANYPPPTNSASYPPQSSAGYPPSGGTGYQLQNGTGYPPPAQSGGYAHPPPTNQSHYSPPAPAPSAPPVPPKMSPAASAVTLPAQVLAMLQNHQQHQQPQQQHQHQHQQPPAPYGAPPPHQQHGDAYDPNNAKVGSLLNMLQQR